MTRVTLEISIDELEKEVLLYIATTRYPETREWDIEKAKLEYVVTSMLRKKLNELTLAYEKGELQKIIPMRKSRIQKDGCGND